MALYPYGFKLKLDRVRIWNSSNCIKPWYFLELSILGLFVSPFLIGYLEDATKKYDGGYYYS